MNPDTERLAISILYALGVSAVIVLLFQLLDVFPPLPHPIGPTEVRVELAFPTPVDRVSEEPRQEPPPTPQPRTETQAATRPVTTPAPEVPTQTPSPVAEQPVQTASANETVQEAPPVTEPTRQEDVASQAAPANASEEPTEEPAEDPLSFDSSALDQALAQAGETGDEGSSGNTGSKVVQDQGVTVEFQGGADSRVLLEKPKPVLPANAFSDARPVINVTVECEINRLGRVRVTKIQSTGSTEVDQIITDTLQDQWRFASVTSDVDIHAIIQFEIRAK